MAHVEDEHPGALSGSTPTGARSATGTLERGVRADRGVKARPRDDDDQMDADEFAKLLDA